MPGTSWSDHASGSPSPHNASGLASRVIGQDRKLRSAPCRHRQSPRTHRRLRGDLGCPRQARTCWFHRPSSPATLILLSRCRGRLFGSEFIALRQTGEPLVLKHAPLLGRGKLHLLQQRASKDSVRVRHCLQDFKVIVALGQDELNRLARLLEGRNEVSGLALKLGCLQ